MHDKLTLVSCTLATLAGVCLVSGLVIITK